MEIDADRRDWKGNSNALVSTADYHREHEN